MKIQKTPLMLCGKSAAKTCQGSMYAGIFMTALSKLCSVLPYWFFKGYSWSWTPELCEISREQPCQRAHSPMWLLDLLTLAVQVCLSSCDPCLPLACSWQILMEGCVWYCFNILIFAALVSFGMRGWNRNLINIKLNKNSVLRLSHSDALFCVSFQCFLLLSFQMLKHLCSPAFGLVASSLSSFTFPSWTTFSNLPYILLHQ